MADDTFFEVIFRGDISAGQQLAAVKARLKALFKVDDGRIEQLFSGRPEVIRRGLDQATAHRYRDTLLKAGALVQVRQQAAGDGTGSAPIPAASAPPPPAPGLENDPPVAPDASGPEGEWTLAPVGADVLRPQERHRVQPVVVENIDFELAPAGADLLKPEERNKVEAPEIDVSHLTVEAPEEDKTS